jgi:hypothetical protein
MGRKDGVYGRCPRATESVDGILRAIVDWDKEPAVPGGAAIVDAVVEFKAMEPPKSLVPAGLPVLPSVWVPPDMRASEERRDCFISCIDDDTAGPPIR